MHSHHIADLVLRSLQGELGELEQRQFQKWLDAAPENEEYHRRLLAAWRLVPAAKPSARRSVPPEPADLIRRAKRRQTAAIGLPMVPGRLRSWAFGIAAAAVVAAAVGPGLLRRSDDPAGTMFRAEAFTTRATETATVRLSDGSFVRLAPNSVLRVEPSRSMRQVVLQGRAFFAVASDPTRPFLVRTSIGTARALGTQFEVLTERDRLRLAVVEGRVALTTGRMTVEVGESEVSHVRAGGVTDVVAVENIYDLLRFPGGLLVYQTMPLVSVARELEYHFGVRIEITDDALGTREFTGSFANESFEEVLTSVCRATGAQCAVAAGTAVIAPRTSAEGRP